MAIGDGSSKGYQNSKPYENTYYSRVRFKNESSQININYHSGLMQLEIGHVNSADGFKFIQEGTVYLSANKAYLLAGQIANLLTYREGSKIDPNKAFGVVTGIGDKQSFIGFSVDKDKNISVTMGKFDNSGVIIEKSNYKFASEYHFAIEWDDISANKLTRVFDDLMEIKMLQAALIDFYKAMMGAAAYGVVDMARWDNHRLNKRIDQIFDKLGIERASYGGNNNRNFGTNDFLSGSSTSSKSTSIEDVEDLLG